MFGLRWDFVIYGQGSVDGEVLGFCFYSSGVRRSLLLKILKDPWCFYFFYSGSFFLFYFFIFLYGGLYFYSVGSLEFDLFELVLRG